MGLIMVLAGDCALARLCNVLQNRSLGVPAACLIATVGVMILLLSAGSASRFGGGFLAATCLATVALLTSHVVFDSERHNYSFNGFVVFENGSISDTCLVRVYRTLESLPRFPNFMLTNCRIICNYNQLNGPGLLVVWSWKGRLIIEAIFGAPILLIAIVGGLLALNFRRREPPNPASEPTLP